MLTRAYNEAGDYIGEAQVSPPLTEGTLLSFGSPQDEVLYVVRQVLPLEVDWNRDKLVQPCVVRIYSG